jgi:hypothetical protein
MEIKINPVENSREIRTLSEFLSAIAVNKGFFWTIHLASQLKRMQSLGIQSWNSTIEGEKVRPLLREWKQQHGYGGQPYGVATGQTKAQAQFATGTAQIKKAGGGYVTQIISPPWVPGRGEKPYWSGKHRTDRPFWQYNGIYKFFNPSNYIALNEANMNIWKKEITGETTLTEAKRALIMSVPQTNKLLKNGKFDLGGWQNFKAKGVASRWR